MRTAVCFFMISRYEGWESFRLKSNEIGFQSGDFFLKTDNLCLKSDNPRIDNDKLQINITRAQKNKKN